MSAAIKSFLFAITLLAIAAGYLYVRKKSQ